LLEESGAISPSDAKKASSSLVSYQDSVTQMLGDKGNENAVLQGDEEEALTLDKSVNMVDMGAICKVFFDYCFFLSC
jgi:hypothetical protein